MWNQNNPFLYDIMVLEEPEQQELQVPGAAYMQQLAANMVPPAHPAAASNTLNIKLPEFWPHAPAMWFARAECRFEMLNVAGERQRFCCVADALPYETLRLVADLVASPPDHQPYTYSVEGALAAGARDDGDAASREVVLSACFRRPPPFRFAGGHV
jgi:hypothetical protein